jgi:hypothetical protein
MERNNIQTKFSAEKCVAKRVITKKLSFTVGSNNCDRGVVAKENENKYSQTSVHELNSFLKVVHKRKCS